VRLEGLGQLKKIQLLHRDLNPRGDLDFGGYEWELQFLVYADNGKD
jgi:hypothetical protein